MRRQKRNKVHYTAIQGSSSRAVYAHQVGMLHNIEMTFVTAEGDEVIVTMPHEIARETINGAIAAYQATMQPLQIARNVPFGI